MQNFYFIIAGGSGIYLSVQLVAYIFWNKVFFADTGILFEQRRNKFEWQMVFPKNLLLLVVFLFSSSLFGMIMGALGVAGYISLPLSVFGGLGVNFLINAAVLPLMFRANKSGAPTDERLAGMNGIAMQQIHPEGYGQIEVTNGGRKYCFDALTANGRILKPGEKIVVIHAENGLCFVESEAHFCDVLFDEDFDPSELQD